MLPVLSYLYSVQQPAGRLIELVIGGADFTVDDVAERMHGNMKSTAKELFLSLDIVYLSCHIVKFSRPGTFTTRVISFNRCSKIIDTVATFQLIYTNIFSEFIFLTADNISILIN